MSTTNSVLLRDNLVPIITPKKTNNNNTIIDTNAINHLVNFHITCMHSRALWVCGGLGLFFDLSDKKRLQVVEAYIQANQKHGQQKLKIFAGATSESVESTLENVKNMKELGVEGIFIAPLYFVQTSEEVKDVFYRAKEIVETENDVPLILYNNPDFARAVVMSSSSKEKEASYSKNVHPDVLRDLSGIVSAVKDSSCNPTLFQQYVSTNIPVYTGEEGRLIDCLTQYGAHGCVAGLGNVSSTCVQITRLFTSGEKITEQLSKKLQKECSAYWGVVHAHPDKKPVVVMAALLLDCLIQAGVLDGGGGGSLRTEDNDFLTEEDRALLKEAGLVPVVK